MDESRQKSGAEFDAIYHDLTAHYRHRLSDVSGKEDSENSVSPEHHERLTRISRELLRLERQTAVRLRNQGRINDETLRRLEHELDLREAGPSHV
jgi:CPA1 family monovalent cation:H+ antiporter